MVYFRIDLPEKQYQALDTTFPYTFEYPVYATITEPLGDKSHPYWINIDIKHFKATFYISYFNIDNNLKKLINDSYTLAYKHDIKADAIDETLYIDTLNRVFGTVYEIKGNAASPLQFYMTDSMRHFMRVSLYFNVRPNNDSLKPVIDFLKQDAKHLIQTLRWK